MARRSLCSTIAAAACVMAMVTTGGVGGSAAGTTADGLALTSKREAQECASPHQKKKLAVVCVSLVARRYTPPGKRELKPLTESVVMMPPAVVVSAVVMMAPDVMVVQPPVMMVARVTPVVVMLRPLDQRTLVCSGGTRQGCGAHTGHAQA